MADMITAKEAAERWNLTERSVTGMCRTGRIPGASKYGKSWYLPDSAEKPADGRIRTGSYVARKAGRKLPLPVGISDYRVASSQYYYVDKTMLIKDFLDERPMVSLFTRPRRFGKTLNMDMLRTFFEKTDEDTSVYFRDKKIWKQGPFYQGFQGKYPVIFVSFKDIKCETWEDTLIKLAETLGNEYARHAELLASPACNDVDKAYFRNIMERHASPTELTSAFMMLTKMLDEHYGTAPVIIVDEYNTPIQQGHTRGFYDHVVLFMRNLFSGGLKDNRHLSFGFLTGILRVAKESIFSGLNNLKINSILDEQYSSYFGFTHDEVKEMTRYYQAPDKYQELCDWYDGYQFGSSEIFNPWSVINYFSGKCQPQAFWLSTSSNDIIGKIIAEADAETYDRLTALLKGESVLTSIDTGVIYPQIRNNPSSVYSFLLAAGYLKAVKAELAFTGDYMCEVAIPNKEIAFVYKKEILARLQSIIPQSSANFIQEALYFGNVKALQEGIEKLLLQSASYYDTAGELFYHGMMLGITAMMDHRYFVTSNRESGEGRYDLQLMPKVKTLPGILIELKAAKKDEHADLAKLAEAALAQIDEKQYDTDMKTHGIAEILKYGVAFSGKETKVVMRKDSL